MLWGAWELDLLIDCLGLAIGARCQKVRTPMQLINMSSSDMGAELGLESQLDRLIFRRCLQRVLESDRLACRFLGQNVRDILTDTSLNAHFVPLSDLTLCGQLSQGGFGVVYKGILASSSGPVEVAVKEMKGDGRNYRLMIHELLKEARVLATLRHPNICIFLGVCADDKPKGKRYMLSELHDCSLYDLIHRPHIVKAKCTLDLSLAMRLSEGTCAGVAYIHANSIVHADLKSPNVLIKLRRPHPVPRICDFGHAAVRTSPFAHHLMGTPHWAAPEVLRGEALGPAADVFSLGVLLWEAIVQQIPHERLSFAQVLACVGWGGLVPDLSLLPYAPEPLVKLLSECLSFSARGRPDAATMSRTLRRLPRAARAEALEMLAGFAYSACSS